MGGGSTFPQHGFTLREAKESDLDDMTRIHIEGFTEEPQVHYCFPLRKQYPTDHWRWTRKEYQNYLEQPEKYLVHLLEATTESNDKVVTRPTGLAVWNLAVLTKATGPDPNLAERKDSDRKRCEAFGQAAGQRFQTYFAQWAEEQINLSALVVHPDYRRRGGGTQLVNWGLTAAEEKRWPVTLCASPMGQLLYAHLKFHKFATEVVQVEGEEEILESAVMARPFDKLPQTVAS
ncbi:acetyltransferase [Colletotrichum liriopes]|uniref:Acetyltransferase n=1 Tax=Colletotrichum liriopes TaxID=708192 RepID=A0AA37GBH9_9PEZI|nr:acetyltransferase [Colletotrichum liriopes]